MINVKNKFAHVSRKIDRLCKVADTFSNSLRIYSQKFNMKANSKVSTLFSDLNASIASHRLL